MRSAIVLRLLLGLITASIGSAKLPDSAAVTAALEAGKGRVVAGNPEAAATAFLTVLRASEPTAQNRVELAQATEEALRMELGVALGVDDEAQDAAQPYYLSFWKAVADRFPEEQEFKTRYHVQAAQSGLVPWETLQPMLIARGDMVGLRLGLGKLSEDPSLMAASQPLREAVVSYVPDASAEELRELLQTASELGLAGIIEPLKARFLSDSSREIQEMAATNFVRRAWHGIGLSRNGADVNAIGSSYDLARLTPPPLPELKFESAGYTSEAFNLARGVSNKRLPKPGEYDEEDPLLWERLAEYEALLKRFPSYADLHRMKARTLLAAGFTREAILALTEGIRMRPSTAMYELRSRCWTQLGDYRAQALADAHKAAVGSIDKDLLRLFCELAMPELLKDDSLVPASWEAVMADRLEMLEERHPEHLGNALMGDAVSFWALRGRFARAQAALARYKLRANPAVVGSDTRIAEWEARLAKARSVAVFYTLPEAPQPHGAALEAAITAGNLKQAWSTYQAWLREQPKAVSPRLFGAAALADLEAPYLALALIGEAKALAPTADEAKALARVYAFCSANLGEMVPAALAEAEASGSGEASFYWLTAFVEANRGAAYRRVSERALTALDAGKTDEPLKAWAWHTFALTAPAAAVEARREQWRAAGGLPAAPEPLETRLTEQVVALEIRLQVAWSDAQLAQGKISARGWRLAAELAAADGRADDGAFAAACWLLGNSQGGDDSIAAWAWKTVAAYRNGGSPDEDPSLALLRDPSNVSAMVRAYENAREEGDVFAAAVHLRRLWLAYRDAEIDLQAACNVAVAAADWELLLSVSHAALATEPSDENRSWYHLALLAVGKKDSAATIREQLHDDSLKAVTEEIKGWTDFVKMSPGYVLNMSQGTFTELHAAVKDAEELWAQRTRASAGPVDTYRESELAKAETAVERRLASASASIRAHMRFQLGEIDAQAYQQSLSDPTDLVFARFFTTLRRWKAGREARIEGSELAEIQSIVYDQGQHLRFRVMAYAMLRLAGLAPEPQPLRASDPILLEDAPAGTISQLRAGRLALTNSALELIYGLAGSRSGSLGAWTYTLPESPVALRLGIAPDLPATTISGPTATNFGERMKAFAERALDPVIARAAASLESELATAGKIQEARWKAYTRVGERLHTLGKPFELNPQRAAEPIMAVITPYINAYPTDALLGILEVKVVPGQFAARFGPEAREAAKIGARAFIADYHSRRAEGGAAFLNSNSMVVAQKVVLQYPPGSPMYSFVKDKLDSGLGLNGLAAVVDAENRRRTEIAVAKARESQLISDFEQAMKRTNFRQAGIAAQTLGGQYYVRWALSDASARMDQLVYAHRCATAKNDIVALTAEINRRTALQQQQSAASRRAYSGDSGGDSWSSFKASASARYESTAAYQRARDEKNGIRWEKAYK